jgi:hypothetical protein
MDQWMSFGGTGGQSPWEFGWNALAAIAALVAAGVALFIHFHQQKVARAADEQRRRVRTEAIAPQLAADVMLLDWRIGTSMRAVAKVVNLPLSQTTESLENAWRESQLQLGGVVGATVPSGDLEWVTDDVRLKLAALRAQVCVTNAMWQRLLIEGPAPFATRDLAVAALLKDAVHQVVDTHTSAILLLQALREHLPEPLKELVESIEGQHGHFETIYNAVREPPPRPRPPQVVPPPQPPAAG